MLVRVPRLCARPPPCPTSSCARRCPPSLRTACAGGGQGGRAEDRPRFAGSETTSCRVRSWGSLVYEVGQLGKVFEVDLRATVTSWSEVQVGQLVEVFEDPSSREFVVH